MAKSKELQDITTVTSLSSATLLSPEKPSKNTNPIKCLNPKLCFFALFLFVLSGMINMCLKLGPISPNYPCGISHQDSYFSTGSLNTDEDIEKQSNNGIDQNNSTLSSMNEFWEQPNGLGFRPCLGFSKKYNKYSGEIIRDRKKYLMVVVSGGMNQQRNQIVDAVVIARVLGAALVVPILQVNLIWGDESEFADIFDLEHFKNVLADDVRIISSLPSTHIMSNPVKEQMMPHNASTEWIRAHYLEKREKSSACINEFKDYLRIGSRLFYQI